MIRLLILLALAGAGAWLTPQFKEGAKGPCPALELRVAQLVGREAGKLPANFAADPRISQFLAMVKGAAASSGGAVAQSYVAHDFPGLPPNFACVGGWWKLLVDPDLGPVVRGLLPR